ncbi:hypothetical protein BaRGS_00010558 [Batillaria attramentaria]|uniref:Uncharacterized protein n=1 Tax=Batillaria attramentaria TaxID=370345 RepID=A0ABD0LGD4_9CAEN
MLSEKRVKLCRKDGLAFINLGAADETLVRNRNPNDGYKAPTFSRGLSEVKRCWSFDRNSNVFLYHCEFTGISAAHSQKTAAGSREIAADSQEITTGSHTTAAGSRKTAVHAESNEAG